MSALSTGLQLQVFSFPWQGTRAKTQTSVNPRQGCPEQPPACSPMKGKWGLPAVIGDHACLGHVASLKKTWDGLHSGKLRYSQRSHAWWVPAIQSCTATRMSLKHTNRYLINIFEKQWLQSGDDGTKITPKATGLHSVRLQIRASALKEAESLPLLLSKYILFCFELWEEYKLWSMTSHTWIKRYMVQLSQGCLSKTDSSKVPMYRYFYDNLGKKQYWVCCCCMLFMLMLLIDPMSCTVDMKPKPGEG